MFLTLDGKIEIAHFLEGYRTIIHLRGNEQMSQQQEERLKSEKAEFGSLLFTWRGPIKRPKVLAHLPGWSKDILYRLEKGEFAPAFDQLRPLYRALWLAGARMPPDGAQLFVKAARARIAGKRTHFDEHLEDEWAALCYDLTRIDQQLVHRENGTSALITAHSPLLLETGHLIGREEWREEVKRHLSGPDRKKIIVFKGPSGIGKSSEVNRLAVNLLGHNTHRPILCDLRTDTPFRMAEESLDIFIGKILSALGYVQTLPHSLDERITVLLEYMEQSRLPLVVFLDHAECILNERGKLSFCWERFLNMFLRFQHRSTLVISAKQWPGWFVGELRFLAEMALPPLLGEQCLLLLHLLGLATVPSSLLLEICEKVGGIPLCLEWVAILA